MSVSAYNPSKKCLISIKGFKGKYLCHKPPFDKHRIECSSNECETNEKFISVPLPNDDNVIAIRSQHARYIGAVPKFTMQKWGQRYTIGHIKEWEMFQVVHNKNKTISFQSVAHEKYLSLLNDDRIVCDKKIISESEQFTVEVIEILPDEEGDKYDAGKVCIIGIESYYDRFVTAFKPPYGDAITCRMPHCREWEYFQSIPKENGLVSLMTYHKAFVSSSESGKSMLYIIIDANESGFD